MDRILTLHFVDGSKLSFEFPEQSANPAARQIELGAGMPCASRAKAGIARCTRLFTYLAHERTERAILEMKSITEWP